MDTAVLLSVISISLAIINIVLVFILLKKNNNKDNSEIETKVEELSHKLDKSAEDIKSSVRYEFTQSRMENANANAAQRKEITAAISDMTQAMGKMTRDSYEFNMKLSELISGKLSEMQRGNEKKLEQMRMTVDEKLNETLTKRLDSSFKAVSDQLENVYKSLGEMKVLSTGVTENVTSLNRILTNVKARGTWAEVLLEGLLNETIPNMYEKNVMTNPATRNIVEFAVKIPSGEDYSSVTYLPIDSKFPMESYVRLCAAADSGDTVTVEHERKALERRILEQAKEITQYINEPATTPFAIMYLATEGLYSEVISSKSGIAERCQNEFSVMIAGPGTITALLNSLSIGFRAMAVNEKAKEVRTLLAAAKVQYEKFGIVLDKAHKKIAEAGKTLEEAQSRNNMIQKKLRTVEEIETGTASQLLGLGEGEE